MTAFAYTEFKNSTWLPELLATLTGLDEGQGTGLNSEKGFDGSKITGFRTRSITCS